MAHLSPSVKPQRRRCRGRAHARGCCRQVLLAADMGAWRKEGNHLVDFRLLLGEGGREAGEGGSERLGRQDSKRTLSRRPSCGDAAGKVAMRTRVACTRGEGNLLLLAQLNQLLLLLLLSAHVFFEKKKPKIFFSHLSTSPHESDGIAGPAPDRRRSRGMGPGNHRRSGAPALPGLRPCVLRRAVCCAARALVPSHACTAEPCKP
jgi:hypothetical protein